MHKKMLCIALIGLILGGAVFALSFARPRTTPPSEQASQKIQVVATIYPLAEFAKNVGGELVEVTTITPPGVEPHEYEPTPQDIVKLYKADLVLINGNGVDAWADKLVGDLRAKQITVIRMSDDQNIAFLSEDPHFWLDPHLAREMAAKITWSLREFMMDSTEKDNVIVEQAQAYYQRLADLDRAFFAGLERCERKEIVTSHNAFRYLAKRYGLTNYYILGLSPEEDPSPRKIAEVSTLAKQKGVKTIFFEALVSPKLAQTIATEIGVGTAVLNPIEGITDEELRAGKDYLQLMQENLQQLRVALACT